MLEEQLQKSLISTVETLVMDQWPKNMCPGLAKAFQGKNNLKSGGPD